jgi:hypothetical protein
MQRSANLVNNIPLLSVAAYHLYSVVDRVCLLEHLRGIEKKTGWRTEDCVLELKALWNMN